MADTAIVERRPQADNLERVLIGGDLSKLNIDERMTYYMRVCESAGLNPLTQPFDYITLNGKLVLYAKKNCTDQLRTIHDISVVALEKDVSEGVLTVTAKVQNAKGRTDADLGSVNIANLKGDALANAIMKASTKAKRRATLSICGLGLLDETEIETIPAHVVETPPQTSGKVINPDTGRAVNPDSARQHKINGSWKRFQDKIDSITDLDELEQWWRDPDTVEKVSLLPKEWQEQAENEFLKKQDALWPKLPK